MRPLYIFDLDGTLALIDHRRAILDEPGRSDDKWRRFYAACDQDEPNYPVISTAQKLAKVADIWIFTGRGSEVHDQTMDWLRDHMVPVNWLEMRPEGDHTPDDELKESWLKAMLQVDRDRLIAVFDDRQRVVDMWRRNGVCCFQVAPGNF